MSSKHYDPHYKLKEPAPRQFILTNMDEEEWYGFQRWHLEQSEGEAEASSEPAEGEEDLAEEPEARPRS